MTENGVQTAEVKTENFICPNCGGALRYDGKKQQFLCSSCGYEGALHAEDNTVDKFDFSGYAQREAQSVPFPGMAVADCQNCGAQITFSEHETATTCPMCGSAQFSQAKQRAGIPPEGIIPFRLDKQDAGQKFREWIKGLWFAPGKLKKSYQEGKLVGRFVPFWTFDAAAFATYTGQGGRYRKVKDKDGKEHTETDWFPVNGAVQESFDDLLVVAATGDGAMDADLVGPYDTVNELRPYAPEYLAGYQAELYTVRADEGFETAKAQMELSLRTMANDDILRRFDASRNVTIAPQYTNITYKHVLLPVWCSVFGYAGKTYRYVVNGATGNVYGQRPYSKGKIAIAIAVAAALILGAVSIFSGTDEPDAQAAPAQETVAVQTHTEPLSQQAYANQFTQMEIERQAIRKGA